MRTSTANLASALDDIAQGRPYLLHHIPADASSPHVSHMHLTVPTTGHSLGIITTYTDCNGATTYTAMTTAAP